MDTLIEYVVGATQAECDALTAAVPTLSAEERDVVFGWVDAWVLMNTDTTDVDPGPLPRVLHRLWPDCAARNHLEIEQE
jgi:hypothetical protein